MYRRSRSPEVIPYDPKCPPVIINLSPILHHCLTLQGFDDRLIDEIKSFVCLLRMDAVKYKYTDKEHKQLTWCHTSSRKRVFSATFGPRGSFQVFQACKNGEIKINTNTPLAKELLDVQDNGVEIFFRSHKQEKSRCTTSASGTARSRRRRRRFLGSDDDDSDEDGFGVTNLFQLNSFYRSDTSSTTKSSRCLKCYVVDARIVFVEERNYTYAGKHGDWEQERSVDFHASSLTEDLISILNDGLATLMKQIAMNPQDLPVRKGCLLKLLTKHIGEERWNLQHIFDLKQSYEQDEDSS